ncbi:MAG: DUF4249 family protein [Chlorobi bacterium]|nr:DUF4249 family protein [Chlorobiota bacterium]
MKNYLLIATILFFITSCETDLQVNDEWRDNTVVYCVLNQKDTAHYVRIGRSFLGEEDAYIMASESDSIQYTETLSVKLERWRYGELKQTINFYPTNEINKETGDFSSENYVLYKSKEELKAEGKYKLVIYIPSLNKTVTSEAQLINDFNYDNVTSNYFYADLDFTSDKNLFIIWTSPEFAKIYQLSFIFHYNEITNYTDTLKDSIIWVIPPITSASVSGGERLVQSINREEFFKFVGSSLKEIPYDVRREASIVDLIITAGSEDFYLYYNLNKPSTGIVQEKPVFTNITNGIGLFTSKFSKKRTWKNGLNDRSIDSLACGQFTQHLNFVDHSGNFHACDE